MKIFFNFFFVSLCLLLTCSGCRLEQETPPSPSEAKHGVTPSSAPDSPPAQKRTPEPPARPLPTKPLVETPQKTLLLDGKAPSSSAAYEVKTMPTPSSESKGIPISLDLREVPVSYGSHDAYLFSHRDPIRIINITFSKHFPFSPASTSAVSCPIRVTGVQEDESIFIERKYDKATHTMIIELPSLPDDFKNLKEVIPLGTFSAGPKKVFPSLELWLNVHRIYGKMSSGASPSNRKVTLEALLAKNLFRLESSETGFKLCAIHLVPQFSVSKDTKGVSSNSGDSLEISSFSFRRVICNNKGKHRNRLISADLEEPFP